MKACLFEVYISIDSAQSRLHAIYRDENTIYGIKGNGGHLIRKENEFGIMCVFITMTPLSFCSIIKWYNYSINLFKISKSAHSSTNSSFSISKVKIEKKEKKISQTHTYLMTQTYL